MYADLMDTIGFVAGYDKEVADAMGANCQSYLPVLMFQG